MRMKLLARVLVWLGLTPALLSRAGCRHTARQGAGSGTPGTGSSSEHAAVFQPETGSCCKELVVKRCLQSRHACGREGVQWPQFNSHLCTVEKKKKRKRSKMTGCHESSGTGMYEPQPHGRQELPRTPSPGHRVLCRPQQRVPQPDERDTTLALDVPSVPEPGLGEQPQPGAAGARRRGSVRGAGLPIPAAEPRRQQARGCCGPSRASRLVPEHPSAPHPRDVPRARHRKAGEGKMPLKAPRSWGSGLKKYSGGFDLYLLSELMTLFLI